MLICHACGSSAYHEQRVNETFQIGDKLVLVEGIPAQVCSRCGETLFSSEIAEKVRLLVLEPAQPIRSIQVDVFAYQ